MALSTIRVVWPAILFAYVKRQECQLTKYCNLIGAATIVAVAQVLPVIVTRLGVGGLKPPHF